MENTEFEVDCRIQVHCAQSRFGAWTLRTSQRGSSDQDCQASTDVVKMVGLQNLCSTEMNDSRGREGALLTLVS